MSKKFEFEFFQLHLVKISGKLVIIWMYYERKKKGAFYKLNVVASMCPSAAICTLN